MKKALVSLCAIMALTVPVAASAQWNDRDRDRHERRDDRRDGRDYRWNGNDRNWDASKSYRAGKYKERRLGRNDQIYRGQDGRAYCKRNDGTTGLVVGAIGGGVLGKLIGGGTLETVIGAGGGALLGRAVDRGNVKCR